MKLPSQPPEIDHLLLDPSPKVDPYEIMDIFPTPFYITKRDSELDSTEEKELEKKEIEDIIKNELYPAPNEAGNLTTKNTYILNTGKLKKLKQFIEKHIDIYVQKIISPKTEANFYITQSWLSVTEPGQSHQAHWHQNSLISGTFYISTDENDRITIRDPNVHIKGTLSFEVKDFNPWNADKMHLSADTNMLYLFPSWVAHEVPINTTASTNRVTIAFNVFAKGSFGTAETNSQLILK